MTRTKSRLPLHSPLLCLALFLIFPLFAILIGACEKSNNMGELRGQWQLISIQYPDGSVTSPGPEGVRRYLSMDLHVVQLTSTDNSDLNFYKVAGDVSGETPDLTFYFPYSEDQQGRDVLSLWGIDDNPARVTVSTLDHNRLVMRVGNNILTLRRF